MVKWTTSLPGSWDVVSGLTGTVPASGLAYASVGDGVAAVGVGLTVYGYSSKTGALEWQNTLTGFPAGAAIVSVRTWPGEVTAGVSYRSAGSAAALVRTEVVISDPAGAQTGRYPAAPFGGAVAGSAKYTVVVGATAVTSYDNATGHVRWQRPTGPVAQAWRTDGNWLYVAESAGGFVDSGPVTALRRIDLATGAELVVQPLEGLEFDGTLSTAFDGVVLFSSAAGVTAYSGTTGARLWSMPGPCRRAPISVHAGSTSPRDPTWSASTRLPAGSGRPPPAPRSTGRPGCTWSGTAWPSGWTRAGSGDAWGYDLAVQRVTLAAAGLPWPHYFVDLSGVGGSADPASDLVIIAACTQLAPSPPPQPSTSAPSGSASASTASPSQTPTGPSSSSASPSGSPSSSPSGSPATSGAPGTSGSASSTPSPGTSPPASAGVGQGCLHPELVALNL